MMVTAISPAINRIRFRFFLSSVPFLSSNLFIPQLSLLRSRSAYGKVIYCQSFLQTGSYVLYFIIWTSGEIVKQNVTVHIWKAEPANGLRSGVTYLSFFLFFL